MPTPLKLFKKFSVFSLDESELSWYTRTMENQMKVGHISASSISSFKACPTRFRLGYSEGIRLAIEPQPLRFGTNWHKGLEILGFPNGTQYITKDNAPGGVIVTDENRLALAVEAATDVYTTIPDYADPTEWAVEREIIANGLAAYHWLYPDASSEYEVVATELQFDLPLVNPETGHATPTFRRVGKIDKIIRSKRSGQLFIEEHKSTSRPIDSGSTYWDRLRKDTQSKFYIVAARDLRHEIDPEADRVNVVSGLLHDAFHKPTIKPSKLTQAESAEFVKTGDYCGQKFQPQWLEPNNCEVDGIQAEIEPGKKEGTFALRETPGMFGARLLQDMTQKPEFYFARREIAFTDAELLDFQYQVWALQRTMAEMERTGHWYDNENQCEAVGSFKCPYMPICYSNVACCDGVTVPSGFKRIRHEETETGAAE